MRMRTTASPVRAKIVQSVLLAAVGVGVGYYYAKLTLPPEQLERTSLPGMYAAMGAVTAILTMRVLTIAAMMVKELRKPKE